MAQDERLSDAGRAAPRRWRGSRAGTFLRRAVFLALGGLLSVPYAAVVVWATAIYQFAQANPLAPLFATGVAVGLFAVPAALRVTASLERTACDELLGTRLGVQPAPSALADVLRSALWFGVHLATGFLAAVLLTVLVPTAAFLAPAVFGVGVDGPLILEGVDPRTTALLAWGGTLASAALLAVVMPQMPRWAVFLLGPSAGQRVALAERQARAAAERNRIARELHDSIGHALVVTTLQAAAARAQLSTDPEAAAAALQAVEETGRRAQEDLDSALAVLREQPARTSARPPGLADLGNLLASFRAAGLAVDEQIDADLDSARLPEAVSREAFRLIQEALANVMRHGSERRAHLHVQSRGDRLQIRIVNGAAPASGGRDGLMVGRKSGGLGLLGIRERITLLGGRLEAGLHGTQWVLDCSVPLAAGQPAGTQ